MSNDQDAIKYINHNKVRIKAGIKERKLLRFASQVKSIPTNMRILVIYVNHGYLCR
ncbi:MAG: hypothetical protein JO327_02810 [Nitrososphaeraceae archaeon]|nr:hypothetical protein [Nitrososphaeraceae archaeon]